LYRRRKSIFLDVSTGQAVWAVAISQAAKET